MVRAGEWHFAESNADGVVDRIGDRGHPRVARILAKPLGAERPDVPSLGTMTASITRGSKSSAVGGFKSTKLALRHLPVARVEAHLLGLRQRQSLDRAALDLVLDNRDVDGTTDVMRGDVLEDPNLAGLLVDFDLDEVRGRRPLDVRCRSAAAVVAPSPTDAAAAALHHLGELHLTAMGLLSAGRRNRATRDPRAPRCSSIGPAAARICCRQSRAAASTARPVPCSVRLPIAAAVVRRDFGIARRRPEHRQRDAEHLAGDHRERRAAALADVGRREEDMGRAVEIDLDGRAARVRRRRRVRCTRCRCRVPSVRVGAPATALRRFHWMRCGALLDARVEHLRDEPAVFGAAARRAQSDRRSA